MPTVFEKDGYRFFFYSNDHRPIHVHVRYGGGEASFDVEGERVRPAPSAIRRTTRISRIENRGIV
jgi:hypothetical protein